MQLLLPMAATLKLLGIGVAHRLEKCWRAQVHHKYIYSKNQQQATLSGYGTRGHDDCAASVLCF